MHGQAVASLRQHAALVALNQIRRERGLPELTHDDILWTWE